MPDIIDVEKPLETFVPSEWIGTGKTYPQSTKIPQFIAQAYDDTYTVPETTRRQLVHDPTRRVRSFAVASLPPPSPTPSFAGAALWFSKDPPSTELSALLNRPVPHPSTLKALRGISGQMWFDGCVSIRDVRYNGGKDYFPLYALHLWELLDKQNTEQRHWQTSLSWISESFVQAASEDEAVFLQAQRLLDTLPWNDEVKAHTVHCTTAAFSKCLGTRWLCDDMINFFVETLRYRLKHEDPEVLACTEIGTLPLLDQVQIAVDLRDFSRRSGRYLHRVGKDIRSGRLRQVFFPANVQSTHWLTIHADLDAGIIQYGTSVQDT